MLIRNHHHHESILKHSVHFYASVCVCVSVREKEEEENNSGCDIWRKFSSISILHQVARVLCLN